MTDKTKTLSIRLFAGDKDKLSKYITRESLEGILRQIEDGEIAISAKGIDFIGVNTTVQGVNTTIERTSENDISESSENSGVNTCDECPYMNDLNMSGFDEVCEYKRLDRQKALDKCVQMLWR